MATANAIRVISSMTVANGNMTYQTPNPTSFQVSQTLVGGPDPGMVVATPQGVNIPFTGLTLPGMIELRNYDATNFVTYGIYDPTLNNFYPLGELLAGEHYVFRLSRYLLQELVGTGTHEGHAAQFWVKAGTPNSGGASVKVYVGAVEA